MEKNFLDEILFNQKKKFLMKKYFTKKSIQINCELSTNNLCLTNLQFITASSFVLEI